MVGIRRDKPLNIIVKAEGGKTARIPVEYTDYQPHTSEDSSQFEAGHLLQIDVLLEAAIIIKHIKKGN